MPTTFEPQWLRWARELQALAQTGLEFADNHYERHRYEAVRSIAAEMAAAGSDASQERISGWFGSEFGYATPKVDVRGVVFRDDAILLVKELSDDGRWTLPGGWADVNDSPSEAAVREVREESGFETRAIKLLAVYDRSLHPHAPPYPYHIYKLFFLCEIIGGQATESEETGGAGFFGENDIPELSLARTTPYQVTRLFAHHRHPDWPADFD
jgi:ADP-ribose pyrophosphatase YjhB (NUDIX family)